MEQAPKRARVGEKREEEEEKKPVCLFDSVPKDVFLFLLSFLDVLSFFRVRRVSRHWNAAVVLLLERPTGHMEVTFVSFIRELAAKRRVIEYKNQTFLEGDNLWNHYKRRTTLPYCPVFAGDGVRCRCGRTLVCTQCFFCGKPECKCPGRPDWAICPDAKCCMMQQFCISYNVCGCRFAPGFCKKIRHIYEFMPDRAPVL
jgi:hypothetical protein